MAIVQPEDDLQPSHAVAASIAADGFPPLTLVGGVFYLLFGPWVIVRYQAVPAASVGYVSVGIGVTLLVVRWLLRTRSSGWVRRHHLSIMVVAAAPASTLPLLSMIAGREAYPATGMVIVLVLLGAAVQRPTWFASMLIVLAASWISIAAWLGIAVTWIRFGVELAMAVVASVGLHLAVRRTVRKLEEARRDLERLANTDELTGVASERRTFDEGNRRLARLAADDASLVAIYVDMDGLKAYNDGAGHEAGDAQLRRLAPVLRDGVRPGDVVGRLGGDEFLILLDDLADANVEDLRRRLAAELARHGLTASMGSARAEPGRSFEDLVRDADRAMYVEKRRARHRTPDGGPAAPDRRPAAAGEP